MTRADLANLSETELLARVIWGECRGADHMEARAIAHVICNRAARPGWWGRDIKSVCLKAKQFSCLNESDPNLPKILAENFSDGSWATCMEEAAGAIEGITLDPTGGATGYHATSMKTFPKWAIGRKPLAKIGKHLFYEVR